MSKPFQISRRSFLATCTTTAVATGLPLWFIKADRAFAAESDSPTPRSANDRPAIALIGCGGMGRGDAQNASRFGDIVAVCDVDETHADAAAKQFSKNGNVPEKFGDFRRIMERNDIQIIVQATPDHWHTLVNLAAAKAKKDVYGEKPLTFTIDEGKHLVKAVRDSGIVFQTGSQQRSSAQFRLACELVRNERIGKLKQVNVFVPAGISGGPFHPVPVPRELNWDFWLGQAPQVEYLTERCHGSFRWWFDYSGGPITDWGAHHNDIARWGIGLDGPTDVQAKALTTPVPGGYTTPSEFEATLMWANGVKQVVKTTIDDAPSGAVVNKNGQRNGVKFEGTDGWIWVNRDWISASDPDLLHTPLPEGALRLENSTDHMGNFFDCVRSRKAPICNIEIGHRSASIGHLIVIALRQGKKFQWDPKKESFTGENADEGNAHLQREMRPPYSYSFIS